MKKGGIAFLLNRVGVLGDDTEFEVSTPTTVAGIRGTAFYVRVESEDSSYICTCNGELETHGHGGEHRQSLAGEHHNALRYRRDADGSVTAEPGEMLYHTDDDMNLLAFKLDYRIPWGF